MYSGKKVIVIGPAPDKEGEPDDYDVVVRFNHSYVGKVTYGGDPILPKRKRPKIYHYPKTDVLYIYRGVRPDPNWNDLVSVKIWLREPQWESYVRNKFWEIKNLELVPQEQVTRLQDALGCNPNTGMVALDDILLGNPAELFITGMTFYRTGYDATYGAPKSVQYRNVSAKGEVAYHKQEPQIQHFVDTIYPRHNVRVDSTLEKIINEWRNSSSD